MKYNLKTFYLPYISQFFATFHQTSYYVRVPWFFWFVSEFLSKYCLKKVGGNEYFSNLNYSARDYEKFKRNASSVTSSKYNKHITK
jgi:hypothetical protein